VNSICLCCFALRPMEQLFEITSRIVFCQEIGDQNFSSCPVASPSRSGKASRRRKQHPVSWYLAQRSGANAPAFTPSRGRSNCEGNQSKNDDALVGEREARSPKPSVRRNVVAQSRRSAPSSGMMKANLRLVSGIAKEVPGPGLGAAGPGSGRIPGPGSGPWKKFDPNPRLQILPPTPSGGSARAETGGCLPLRARLFACRSILENGSCRRRVSLELAAESWVPCPAASEIARSHGDSRSRSLIRCSSVAERTSSLDAPNPWRRVAVPLAI